MSSTPTPLLVYCGLAGTFLCLEWWTYDDRSHLAVARNEKSLMAIASRIAAEHPDAEARSYQKIELVAPSRRIRELATQQRRREAVEQFWSQIHFALLQLLKANVPLPGGFTICSTYEPTPEVVSNDPDTRKYAQEHHYGCTHCRETIRSPLTPDELWDRYADRWAALEPPPRFQVRHAPKGPRRVESQAPTAADDEILRFAVANFGHHSSGIELRTMNPGPVDEGEHNVTDYLSVPVLFFYRELATLDTAPIERMFREAQAQHDARRAAHQEASQKSRERAEQERLQRIVKLFSE